MSETGQNQLNQQADLSATEFSPLESPHGRKKLVVSPGLLILGFISVFASFVLIYLFVARAVIFIPDPVTAEIEVGGISFNIGNNFLLLRGERKVSADASGYRHFEELIPVSGDRSQEIVISLEPLPLNSPVS